MLWFSHLRRMLQRDRLEKDLDEELRLHLDMRAADNMTAGMTPEEAGRDARRRLENVTALKTGNMGTSRHSGNHLPYNDVSEGLTTILGDSNGI